MTLLYYHDIFLRHDPGPFHPEGPRRLERTLAHLKASGLWEKLKLKVPRQATLEEITAVHTMDYIRKVEGLAQRGGGYLDPDTVVSTDSYQAALYAAGACLEAIDAIMRQEDSNAFCMVRPPGHHALPARGMGFCIFNNIAIAARYLISRYGLGRILIVDWDCHHGNGTQEIFYEDPRVLYLSLHRWPLYPGTGSRQERGKGPGEGFTINIPLGAGISSGEYIEYFQGVIKGRVRDFGPEFILVSAGFDTYREDPIGGLGLEAGDFGRLTRLVLEVARECSGGRLVSCLEGGYSLEGLPRCIEEHLLAMIGE